MVHDLAKVEMCYSARVESLPIRMLQGLDMEEPQSLGFLAAEAQVKNEAGHAFSNGQLPNGACLRWDFPSVCLDRGWPSNTNSTNGSW
jgi:hypothetical protein